MSTYLQKGKEGVRNNKGTFLHKQKMIQYVENDPLIILIEIKHKLQRDQGIMLSITTIHNHLECQFYSIKKVLPQPVAMKSVENKTKRAAYVSTIMENIALGKTVIYIDETNCNLFLRNNYGDQTRIIVAQLELRLQKEKTYM